ncbi:unnamed protein product [Symbiodinium sp. CCMP2592]|nr:unnamed protein product [Symbiodinium sp. CCMP2592]
MAAGIGRLQTMGVYKSTKEALDRGVKLKKVVKEQKTASKSSKWRAPDLPLSTPLGVGGLTLGSLMKQEKLEYPDAVAVYLAFQDTQKSSSPSTKKPSKKTPTETEDTHTACNSAPSGTAKKKSSKQAPTETKDTQSACNSVPSRTANKKSPKQALEKTETEATPKRSRNQVTPRSRPSKAALRRGVASSNLGLEDPAEDTVVQPAKRIKGKRSPEAAPNPEDCTPPDEDEDAICMPWDEIEQEYNLWRDGLPQLSELDKYLKAHRELSTQQSQPVAAPAMLALPAPAADQSGSTFVDGQDRLRTAQPLSHKDRQDSQTNLSDLGPSASQVAASLDMLSLMEKVKQLELEKAELQSQLSSDSTTKPEAPSDAEPADAKASEPADSKPLATPVRNMKEHVFHESPPPAVSPASVLPASMLAKIRTQSEPVPKPALSPAAAQPEHDQGKINSASHRKEYAKLEKRRLLREWVTSGQNLQACESSIEVSHEAGAQLALDAEHQIVLHATIGLHMLTYFRIKQNMKVNCRPGGNFFDGPIPGADPGLLHKKPAVTQQAPLKADVLREFDQRKEELSALAARWWSQQQIYETTAVASFLTTPGLGCRFYGYHCKEIKKNVNGITDLIFDMGDASDDDSQRLLKDLKSHKKKLEQLAKKFHSIDPESDTAAMDQQCDAIHDEVQSLSLCKGQIKGGYRGFSYDAVHQKGAKKAAGPPKVADVLDQLVRATCAGDTSLTVACDLGDAYGSRLLDGYSSRPLREAEFHSRLSGSGLSFDCEPTWINAPAMNNDLEQETIEAFPILLPSNLARCLLQEGFLSTMVPGRAALEEYWEKTLLELSIPLLDGRPDLYHRAIPVLIWGDEATPDLSECRTDSKASRYIMYSLLVQNYLIRAKTNVTLQTLNAAIVDDFNKLSQEGLQMGDEVYYFIPVGFRGDLKQMGQAFNLTRKPGSEKVCFYCEASMGRKSFNTVYTDVSEAAGWRSTMHHDGNCGLPWTDEPSFP